MEHLVVRELAEAQVQMALQGLVVVQVLQELVELTVLQELVVVQVQMALQELVEHLFNG